MSSNSNCIKMTKKDWMRRFTANPDVNQKNILMTFDIINIPQISIENEPTDFVYFMSEY